VLNADYKSQAVFSFVYCSGVNSSQIAPRPFSIAWFIACRPSRLSRYPHHLEDGLTQHPSEKVRERVFGDRSRSDVILLDRKERPVIVECKQGQPTVADIEQLRGYLGHLLKEKNVSARGILVHGGAKKLHADVNRAAAQKPMIEVVQHRLQVEFSRCN